MKLGMSPITGLIYAGNISRDGTRWLGNKHDVTSDFHFVVLEKFPVGKTHYLTIDGVPTYSITINKLAEVE